MNDLIVCAGLTHRSGMLDEYERQLAAASVPFHLETLEPLPGGANSINMARRIQFVRTLALRFINNYAKIVITDAWDVLFYGSCEELVAKVPDTLIVSAERNCYPEAEYGSRIQGATPWRYVNNGMMAGSPAYLLTWCNQAAQSPDLDILDQAWFNRRRAEGSDLTPIDTRTELFYVVSATLETGDLRMKDNRPWNSSCDTYPCFFHFSGQCNPGDFRKLLNGERDHL